MHLNQPGSFNDKAGEQEFQESPIPYLLSDSIPTKLQISPLSQEWSTYNIRILTLTS